MTSHSPHHHQGDGKNRECRRPLHTITNHGLRHPFREEGHVNFPPFEDAFCVVHNKTATPDNSTASFLSDNNTDVLLGVLDDAIDDSSSSSDGGMSIGARAALQDHVRHVARYGVDGDDLHHSFRYFDIDDDEGDADDACQDANVYGEKNHHHKSNIGIKSASRDAVWNHLLYTSFTSQASSTSTDRSTRDRSHLTNKNKHNNTESIIIDVGDDKEQENEGIEVSLANTSACYSDYFNTSKVWLLATPEKIKARPQPNLTTTYRLPSQLQQDTEDLDPSDSFLADSDTAQLTHIMLALHLHQHENPNHDHATRTHHRRDDGDDDDVNTHDSNESFAGGVDVSRISAADSERTPLRGSPRRWILDDTNNDSTTTTPHRRPEQQLPDISFGSILSPVMPVTATITASNMRRLPSRHMTPPSLPSDNCDFSRASTFLPRPQRNLAAIPSEFHDAYPENQTTTTTTAASQRTSRSLWLSPTEAHAAHLAREFGAWTAEPTRFPDEEEYLPAIHDVRSTVTRSSPWEDGDVPSRFAHRATPTPSTHRQLPNPLAFPDDYSSVASSSGATSLFLLDDICPKTTNRLYPVHSSLIGGIANADVSFNVSAIGDESADDTEFWTRPLAASPMTSSLELSSPALPPNSSSASSFASSVPMPTSANNVKSTTMTSNSHMEDRRRYRTVVPSRVLFEETDDHHYHHCRDDSFSVAPSY